MPTRKVHVQIEFDFYTTIDPKTYGIDMVKSMNLGVRMRMAMNSMLTRVKGMNRIENYKIKAELQE